MSENPSDNTQPFGKFFGEFSREPVDFSGSDGDVVVSSRIRLSRNLADAPFPNACSDDQKRSTAATIKAGVKKNAALHPQHEMVVLPSEQLAELERQFLIEFQAVIDARQHNHHSDTDNTIANDATASDIVAEFDALPQTDPRDTPARSAVTGDETVVDLDLSEFDLDKDTDEPFLTVAPPHLTADSPIGPDSPDDPAAFNEAFANWNIDDLLPEQPYKTSLFDAVAAADDFKQTSEPTQSTGPQPDPKSVKHPTTNMETGIVINEEDHLQLQAMTSGFDLDTVWKHIDRADDLLEKELCYAYSQQWGYLTACPANVGTAMRASVILHLPALATLGRLDQVFRWLIRAGVVGRGFHGDDAWGDFYRIGNGPTLGKTETQLLNLVRAVVPTIVAYERSARKIMLAHYRESIENQVDNAFRAIKLQVQRSDEELLSLVSSIRLGLAMGLLEPEQINHVRETFELKRLKHQLECAVMLEQYATATRCRDRIRQLEERRHGY